ncbi:hypothetical protein RJ639_001191 [Escallonia herrerae]|uniref:Uncharacterized protein n=1 Tax=Escallonia herrerae TaxID=1293975 RepID=A0AA88XBB9_9ASTE|nr:hypothetical protein RJ639_001191 [Escallonia herrerae]
MGLPSLGLVFLRLHAGLKLLCDARLGHIFEMHEDELFGHRTQRPDASRLQVAQLLVCDVRQGDRESKGVPAKEDLTKNAQSPKPFDAHTLRRKLSSYDLKLQKDRCEILPSVKLRLPDEGESANMTIIDEIGVYGDMFINGFTVPLHLFFIEVLNAYGLALGQFSPHAWRFINLSGTDLKHTEKLKGAEPIESIYPLSNTQLRECGVIFSPEPQNFEEEEEESENDPGHTAQVQIGAEKLIIADKVLDEEKKKVMIENNFHREAEKKVEDLSKKLEQLELSNAGLIVKNVELSAQVNDLEAKKSTVALQAVQLFKISKAFMDQRYRDSKGALVHEAERRAAEAERKKAASSRALTSPSISRSLGTSGSVSVTVLRPQMPVVEDRAQGRGLSKDVAEPNE